jgi:hypothetical protein
MLDVEMASSSLINDNKFNVKSNIIEEDLYLKMKNLENQLEML